MENSRVVSFRQKRQLLRKRNKNIKTVLWLIIFLIIGIFYYSITYEEKAKPLESAISDNQNEGEVAGAIAQSPVSRINTSPSPASFLKQKTLQATVEKSLEGTTGTYAVLIKNLKTGESFSINEGREFEAGSLYKLWTMAVIFNEIESGELKEDEELSQGIAVLNRKFGIDPELAEQTQGTITLTVKEALNQMITISHNYAALLLTEKLKLSTVAAFLQDQGFNSSKVGTDGSSPTTTASDMARFFEKLYKKELGNSDSTEKMLTLLKAQKLNNKLPKNLPSGTIIAHKTGELGWFSHDAGIIYSSKGHYIIVAMSESPSPKGAEERIADLSLAVFNYFNQNP